MTVPIQMVSDGGEAIAYILGEGKYSDRKKFAYPTFIITDLKMPKADGFAVLEFLKSNPKWKMIPTIVLSPGTPPRRRYPFIRFPGARLAARLETRVKRGRKWSREVV